MRYKIHVESSRPDERLAYYGIVTIPYQGERRRVHGTPPCATPKLARQYAEQWVRTRDASRRASAVCNKKPLTPEGK